MSFELNLSGDISKTIKRKVYHFKNFKYRNKELINKFINTKIRFLQRKLK